jgi:ribosomal protein S6
LILEIPLILECKGTDLGLRKLKYPLYNNRPKNYVFVSFCSARDKIGPCAC